jgi:hypothetical protein
MQKVVGSSPIIRLKTWTTRVFVFETDYITFCMPDRWTVDVSGRQDASARLIIRAFASRRTQSKSILLPVFSRTQDHNQGRAQGMDPSHGGEAAERRGATMSTRRREQRDRDDMHPAQSRSGILRPQDPACDPGGAALRPRPRDRADRRIALAHPTECEDPAPAALARAGCVP